jgi:hypothetical protein
MCREKAVAYFTVKKDFRLKFRLRLEFSCYSIQFHNEVKNFPMRDIVETYGGR